MQDAPPAPKRESISLVRALAESVVVVLASLVALTLVATTVGPYWSPLGMLGGVAAALGFIQLAGGSLADYGFRRSSSLANTLGTTAAMLALAFLTFFLLDPLLTPVFGAPDFSVFDPLEDNGSLYVTMLLMSWIGAAFGEEVIYRGFVQTRIALAAGGGNAGWWLAILIQAAIFSSLHLYQGWTGVIEIFVFGLGVGLLYKATGRSLLPLILGHGIIDTLAMTAFYLGRGDVV